MIHQVYGIFNDGIELTDIPIYKLNVDETILFCEKHNLKHKLWNLKDCEKLIDEDFPEYKQLWDDYRYPIQRADFIRYCILYKYGGLYVDCDIRPVKNLDSVFNEPIYFVYWNNDKKKLPYNAILASHQNNKLMLEIIKQCKVDFYEKSKIQTYETWKGRFVFQTTGHSMLERVIKKNNIDKDKYFHDVLYVRNFDKGHEVGDCNNALFYDANASVWYDNFI
tara:strand:- start:117 stop:782 length:666 start_codon:yes stop_codon:yes gene_type:complete